MNNITNTLKKIYLRNIPKEIRYNFNNACLLFLINGIFSGCYAPFWGIIAREHFKTGPFWIGLVFASQYIYGIVSLIVAGFVPKGKEHIYAKYIRILASSFLIISPFMKTGPLFCSMLFLFHVSACYAPMDNSVFAYIFPINIRSKMLGYIKMLLSISSMIVTLIVGVFINYKFYNISLWQIFFVIGGLVLASCGFIMGRMKIEVEEEKKENPITFIKNSFYLLKEDKFNYYLISSGIFFTIAFNIFSTLYPIYQVDALHISGKEVSIITVVGGIGLIFAYPILGNFYSKMHPVKTWLYVYPLMIIYPLFFIFMSKSWFPLTIGFLLNQGFIATNDIAWINIIIYLGGKDKIKEYQGLYAFFIGIRALIGLFVSTFVINYCEKLHYSVAVNLKIAFVIGICFAIISLIFMIPVRKLIKN